MDSCRRQQSQGDHEATYESQRNTKPLSLPFWDQKFCWTVGNAPWGKLLETKKNMHLYKNIVQWNDSVAQDAFTDAKNRFLDKVDGLPCYIALPDSDAYIDEIDWSNSRTSINPEPVSDPSDESGEHSGDDNSSVDNEDDVDHKEAADIAGFENDAWNKLDHKMLQELMMGLMLESPLW
uniref:uncharacterized protein LOC105353375 n=1 Tax=Fragaria vesca subsp. vesca TaxID=101020 RepID=UPI0005C97E6A|nr:PREDICTED: uncharacterized protein LOC105353375 [Fragaria vesca subsp. vesca]